MSDEFPKELSMEYYKLFDIVNEFDKRLLTIKSWGLTFSLGALALGSKKSITASLSSLALVRLLFGSSRAYLRNIK